VQGMVVLGDGSKDTGSHAAEGADSVEDTGS
jgi:hypothetical protein